jgi:hypothetical protein
MSTYKLQPILFFLLSWWLKALPTILLYRQERAQVCNEHGKEEGFCIFPSSIVAISPDDILTLSIFGFCFFTCSGLWNGATL